MALMDPWPEDQQFCHTCGHAMVRQREGSTWWSCLNCTDSLHRAHDEILLSRALHHRPEVRRDSGRRDTSRELDA